MDMNGDDIALVKSAQGGNRAAFQQLLSKHYGLIYRVAWRFTGNNADAEDVAQEVCIGLAKKLTSFRGDSKFTTWIYKVVVNACRDYQKKQRSGRNTELNYVEVEKRVSAENAEEARKVLWLYRCIALLTPPLPETALLVLGEELNHAEAGKILGCAESTVSWRMHEIRKQLKAMMDSYHG